VSITLNSGAVLRHAPIQHAKGSWALPMTSAELADKFRGCVAPVLGASHTEALLARLETFDEARSVFELPLALDKAA
jgi:hypothetical protein